MAQACLDSLSEDWDSPKEYSKFESPMSCIPVPSSRVKSKNLVSQIKSSRIPISSHKNQTKSLQDKNEISLRRDDVQKNKPSSPHKLEVQSNSGEPASERDSNISLRASTSTESLKDNTVQRKHFDVSLVNEGEEVPNWKKLISGKPEYGGQPDLFSRSKLESVFEPPSSEKKYPFDQPLYSPKKLSASLPSSPPHIHRTQRSDVVENTTVEKFETSKEQKYKWPIRYRLADKDLTNSQSDDSTISSRTHPALNLSMSPGDNSNSTYHVDGCKNLKGMARRLFNSLSDLKNEELSQIQVEKHEMITGEAKCNDSEISSHEPQQKLENPENETLVPQIREHQSVDSFKLPENELVVPAHTGKPTSDFDVHEDSCQTQLQQNSKLSLIHPDESGLLPEESLQASTPKQLPLAIKTSPTNEDKSTSSLSDPPKTPEKIATLSEEKQLKSSPRSPLKIFEPHDTYTNRKLNLRMEQLEDEFENKDRDITTSIAPYRGVKDYGPGVTGNKNSSRTDNRSRKKSRDLSSFGVGKFDDYKFIEDASYNSHRRYSCQNIDGNMLPNLNSNFKSRSESYSSRTVKNSDEDTIHHEGLTSMIDTSMRSMKHSRDEKSLTNKSQVAADFFSLQSKEILHTPRNKNGDTDAKRQHKTPVEYPDPKRRRTSRQKEANENVEVIPDTTEKNAIFDNEKFALSINLLTKRITPACSLKLRHRPSSELRFILPHENNQKKNDFTTISHTQKNAEHQPGSNNSEFPSYPNSALGVGYSMSDESNKGSLTTSEFLYEAKELLADLRKVRPQKRSGSVGESVIESERSPSAYRGEISNEMEDSYQESSQEPFSRPPSRDGAAPLPRLPRLQKNPALLDHLRKYQENFEEQTVAASSLGSIAQTRDPPEMTKVVDRLTEENTSKDLIDRFTTVIALENDPPNVRISEKVELKHKYSLYSALTGSTSNPVTEYPSQGSNFSLNQSTIHSIPTESSRGSDSRRIIVPESVSHLIPQNLAGMVFDHERRIWVKKSMDSRNSNPDLVSSDRTEDDPFENIPDLSVDETLERQRIKVPTRERHEEKLVAKSEPISNNNNFIPNSSKRKQISNQALSPSFFETPKISTENLKVNLNHIEKPLSAKTPTKRSIMISFSSPIASFIENREYQDQTEPTNGGADISDGSKDEMDVAASNFNASNKIENNLSAITSNKLLSSRGGITRRISIDGHKFSTRPVSRIEEQDEDNYSSGKRRTSSDNASVLFTNRKSSNHHSSVVLATPRMPHEIGTLTLTPLSDFTIHQANNSFGLDVSYVAQQKRYKPENGKKTLSLSIKELVQKISEVEPYEPFWEHLKDIDLKGKQLKSVHKLDEFCERLEGLDVSHNQLSHLDGVPKTVRSLHIINNSISDMTAWGHLINLQYVDVSNNQLESLSSLKALVHLRGLRADKNSIVSLEGIDQLGGLLSLRLRGNKIRSINFQNTKLHLLTDLDLRDNCISKFENFQQLRSLTKLDLVDNALTEFLPGCSEPLESIKYLRLCGNSIESMDVRQYPNLRLLYLDRNRLGKVMGLLKTKYLDSLSLRGQRSSTLDSSFLSEAFEVRKIFLSSNLLSKFEPQTDFLNLQYLELANCGLESLPPNLGLMLANVRVLNLNFNALTDIRPLFGIIRLKRLYLAGNRLLGLEIIAKLLACFPTLALIDLRNNPLTLGFYSPILDQHISQNEPYKIEEPEIQEPYTMSKSDKTKDELYKSCLDMRTQMKRRIYEMYIIGSVLRLKLLDGLPVDRSLLVTKDMVYHSMVAAGFITRPSITQDSSNASNTEKYVGETQEKFSQETQQEEIWPAEDSFG